MSSLRLITHLYIHISCSFIICIYLCRRYSCELYIDGFSFTVIPFLHIDFLSANDALHWEFPSGIIHFLAYSWCECRLVFLSSTLLRVRWTPFLWEPSFVSTAKYKQMNQIQLDSEENKRSTFHCAVLLTHTYVCNKFFSSPFSLRTRWFFLSKSLLLVFARRRKTKNLSKNFTSPCSVCDAFSSLSLSSVCLSMYHWMVVVRVCVSIDFNLSLLEFSSSFSLSPVR